MGNDGKTFVLGVTGCIAAYKACEIVRALQKESYDVWVVMTANAQNFVGKATFEALTGHPVVDSLFGLPGMPIPHIDLAARADGMLIAPCTANAIAKIAQGIADDALSSTVLACTCPVAVAPAMNVHMFQNAATQRNLAVLAERGVHVIKPATGRLACGEVGEGKLPEVGEIVESFLGFAVPKGDFKGKRILITAGPTQEPIDPVRYISNCSSGKMGYALAAKALERGAEVILISGPVSIAPPLGARAIPVRTAQEMYDAAVGEFPDADIAICTAAVCDMRPAQYSQKKLKKGADGSAFDVIGFVANPDILAKLGASKHPGQFVVGFAAETENLLEYAGEKRIRKHADLIVANCVADGAVFGSEENAVTVVGEHGATQIPKAPKLQVAGEILDMILRHIDDREDA